MLNKFSLWVDFFIVFCIFLIIAMTITLKMFLKDPEKVAKFIELEEEKIKWNFRPKESPDYLHLKNKEQKSA